METHYIIFLAFFLLLLLNGCSAIDEKANAGTNLDPKSTGASSSNEKKGGSDLVTKPAEVDKVREDKGNQVNNVVESVNIKNDRTANNSTNEMHSKDADNRQEINGDSNDKSRAKKGDNGKGNLSDEMKPEDVPKGGGNVKDLETLNREGTQGEGCDSSNKCNDHGQNFVACLRVPGNDSPDLSLLIQKQVNGPLSVTISAPEYVQLEKTEVHFQEQTEAKVKVSIGKGGTDNLIFLMTGNGNCSLDFGALTARNSGEESDNSPKSRYFNFMSRKPIIIFVSLAAVLILASGCMCVSIRWRQFSNRNSKYQRLDMELPVSGVRKSEPEINDGWDNSWGDDWDDDEAPKTPSMPVTPSLSSKGLASRRLNKDGWKD